MFSFVNPLFLLLVPAVVVPAIIHLTRHDTAARLSFPATSLLMGSAEVIRRKRSFVERVLLAMRLGIVFGAILVFARPKVLLSSLAATDKRLASVAIVLDDTPSMGARYRPAGTAGDAPPAPTTRMDEAKRAARHILDGLETGSRIRLQTATALILDETVDPREALEALNGVEPSEEAPSLWGALADCSAWISREPPPDRSLYVISDFQKSSWRGAPGSWLGPGVSVRAVDLGSGPVDDWGIGSVTTVQERAYRGVPLELKVGVVSSGGGTRRIELVVDGAVVHEKPLALVATERTEVAFEVVPQLNAPLTGEVRLVGADDFPANDTRAFAVNVMPSPSVLVVSAGAGVGRLAGEIVSRALAPFVGGEHEMAVVRQTVPPLAGRDELEQFDCIVLASPSTVPGDEWPKLSSFVERGGGLFVFADEGMAADAFWRDARGLLPALGAEVVTPGTPPTLVDCEFDHPALRSFAEGGNGDILRVRFNQILRLDAGTGTAGAPRRLAAFSSGALTPAIAERSYGRGRVMLFASNPAGSWSTFFREPSFLPFMHEATAHLARSEDSLRSYTVGQRVEIELRPSELGGGAELKSRLGERATLLRAAVDDGRMALGLGVLGRRGVFDLQTGPPSARRTRAIAVEIAGGESERERLSPTGLLGLGTASSSSSDAFALRLSTDRGGIDVSLHVLWCVIVLFAMELVLSALLTRKRSHAPGQSANVRGAI